MRDRIGYNPDTGEFHWLATGKSFGMRYRGPGTYRYCTYQYVQYSLHRLAWWFHYGKWPDNQIDHINGDKGDNRIANLRDVTAKENAQHRERQRPSARDWMKSRPSRKGWI